MTGQRFHFASGNFGKLLAAPKYALAWLLSWWVPRLPHLWVFGSGIGFGEGALAVARALRADDADARIVWIAGDEAEASLARAEGFEAILRRGWAGFWITLRAGQVIITHGLGDVNRFGIFGGHVVNLIHGAPLKKLHLDSLVTTQVRGPAPVRALLRRMYLAGTTQLSLIVAGSILSAERLRSAYRVDPGRVRVLGDPRDDVLCEQAKHPSLAQAAREDVLRLFRLDAGGSAKLVLYAPTWRDGDPDPAVPIAQEIAQIHDTLERVGAHLFIRSHPLGGAAYHEALGERVHLLGADLVHDITPLLGAFDSIITDYSSIAIDFSLLHRPIVWFAPDLEQYSLRRGLYEPLEVTAAGRVHTHWQDALERLEHVLTEGSIACQLAQADARSLARRFHAYPEGGAARRVITEIRRLSLPDHARIPDDAIFFESFYGKQVSCNPLALDREIAKRFPDRPRYWSVTSERIEVPEGATALLVGSPDWFAARRRARLLIVNDWLRYGFRRGRHQTVLQTWHGTMLKRLALARSKTSVRTRLAVHRESRRWSLLLSQNPHSTAQFRSSYAFRGEVLELGYPRDDRLADAVVGEKRMDLTVAAAKRSLGINPEARVLAYVPTWRAEGELMDTLDVHTLAAQLGDEWIVVVRGHTRSGGIRLGMDPRVVDATAHPDVNDVILAADLLVTDYSSVMFDAAVARVPMMFYVPDLAQYRDRERGFTFDFVARAPGPLATTIDEVVRVAHTGLPLDERYAEWCNDFVPHDDGHAARRVVDALLERNAFSQGQ